MKTLLSWLAFNNDFLDGAENKTAQDGENPAKGSKPTLVNRLGPTMGFHESFYKGYDRHILLSQEKVQDDRLSLLTKELASVFPKHKVETRLMALRDIIDVGEISTKIDELISSLPEDEEIDLFISPGTPAMQTAWYLLQLSTHRAKRVLQTRRNPVTKKQELIEVAIALSSTPVKAIIFNKSVSKKPFGKDLYLTDELKVIYNKAVLAAKAHRVPVLIIGETGTGKEHLAEAVLEYSARKEMAFKAVNCGALQESILERTLFGYKKGAFPGAKVDQIGLFEAANGGTIFLDEVADISPKMQLALLRVLQTFEVLPIGATDTRTVDVRVIASTNKDLRKLCMEDKFRWDLYYRLAVIELRLPSLLEWSPKDRRKLLMHTIHRLADENNLQKELDFSQEAMDAILAYRFPGNIRELENLVQRLLVFSEGSILKTDLPTFIQQPDPENSFRWKDVEKAHIQKVLHFTRGNKRQTMKLLDYGSPNTLTNKIKEYGIETDDD